MNAQEEGRKNRNTKQNACIGGEKKKHSSKAKTKKKRHPSCLAEVGLVNSRTHVCTPHVSPN